MTMAVLAEKLRPASHLGLVDALRAARAWHRRRRAERAGAARLAHLDAHLLADIGIDPEAVRGRRQGWDDLLPNGYLIHR
ncbi:DUF1127 domain-containing protein [Amaricoccus sp.]|uniref:DUF1127 domain-containing protein n=1 Tax=Amaricoccus sp. TaxID=1872485 RepID=UPI00262528C2|nr:DUF1127 domain-containing protein [Amaricoccus sp.]HRO11254.1 DUF1127 domain-containing protein [Amaricoccus sp.]